MAHSLELRVPFLDRAVFEVAARCRPLKVPHRTTKYALRRALAGSCRTPSSTGRSSAFRRRPGCGCAPTARGPARLRRRRLDHLIDLGTSCACSRPTGEGGRPLPQDLDRPDLLPLVRPAERPLPGDFTITGGIHEVADTLQTVAAGA